VRCTRQTPQNSGEHPVHHRALAALQERARKVVEGAPALLLLTAVTLESGLVSGTYPMDRRGSFDTGGPGVTALSTAPYGYRIDRFRR
jgi:hypothetical protein